ncbi:substrate-binding domain-containing protein [Sphaerochaeta halotolerans]|jgi:ribose transport system substrate-binding protein|uniref:Sugar ABC transporter substrate-binding protein n=1 Tax=Sphaerochaeta halotolerans TaxID=2293840 RepID=A0A372MK40_9SPIR|nr:substrate-binding domain-containing protein [Sphaerochaeta halotolerans]MDK2859237.1 ribose transport system substrate-binding protein [Sphaerochaeta sp.]MDN5333744.1 ribose transport system substrate-binding protein [Sphaerochaeta sp.]MXI86886.1 substrate-binding domain-containing protein [Sphaerochaeta halotolerans]RFU96145.1 sugar ABC transporter substrate-binding protein [Sphaerochaeta halotolerans]
MKRTILLLLIPLLLLSGCSRNQQDTNTPYRIAVITMMQGGEFWGALKNGARSARLATGAVLEFFAPVNESDYSGQIAFVEEAIAQEFDAIILSPSHHTQLEHVVGKARSAGIKVVFADTGLLQEEPDFLITADYQMIGKHVAEHAFSHFSEDEPINALIIGSLPNTTSMTALIGSLETAFHQRENARINSVAYSFSSEVLAHDTAVRAIKADPSINLIFALEEYTAHGVAAALSPDPKIHFIAFGNTQHEIQLLEAEVIDALVVVNSFNLGYRSVLAAVELLEGKRPVQKLVDFALVTKESMFSEEHQHILFQTFQ